MTQTESRTPLEPSRGLTRALSLSLAAWAIGVQTLEPLASAGLVVTFLLVLVHEWPLSWKSLANEWKPLWVFLGWGLLAPLIAARWPTGSGVARRLDWLGLWVAAVGIGVLPRAHYRRILWGAAVVFVLSCGVAGFQSYGIWPGPEFFRPVAWLKLPLERVYEEGPNGRFMAGGLLFHRLKFAHVGGLAVIVAFATALRSEGRTRGWAAAVALAGLFAVVAFPFARAAVVALGLSMIAMVLLVFGTNARVWGFASLAVALGLGVVGLSPLRERFLVSATAEGNGSRAILWSSGLEAANHHPLFGLGLGRFHPGDFRPKELEGFEASRAVQAHNQWITFAAETGWVGVALFVWLLAWMARRISAQTPEGLAALGALGFFVLLSLFHDPLFHAPFSMALVWVLGNGLRDST